MNSVLERLASNIFREPYASNGRVKGDFESARRYPKSVAMTMPVLQINGPRRITYICFDIDRPYAGIAWDDANLPPPNLIVVNPKNLHAHLIYELAEPIWLRKGDDTRPGDAHPIRFLKAVKKAMGDALGADNSYSGLMTKNPFHASWLVSSGRERPYTLSELSEHLDLETSTSTTAVVRESSGRRATLFDSIRYWAYQEKSNYSTLESFHEAIIVELERLNNGFEKGPEAFHSIKSIAKSVSEWVWHRYTRKRCGIMNLDSSEPIKIRQQKGQQFTSRLRTRKTLDRIRDTVRGLVKRGVKVTKTLVASLSGFSRGTIRGYWNEVINSLVPSSMVPHETEGLWPKSSSGPYGAEVGGIPDSDPTDHPPANQGRSILKKLEAIKLARQGILAEWVPEGILPGLRHIISRAGQEKLKHALSSKVDMWRNTRSIVNEECTD